jgi:hypothetical protein
MGPIEQAVVGDAEQVHQGQRHVGRKSGTVYHTPVNFAEVDGDIICTAGILLMWRPCRELG